MSDRSSQQMTVRAVATLLAGATLLWVLYQIRGALLVMYISGLLALGFNPIVRVMERQPIVGTSRIPRWAALLILYFGLLSVAAALFAIVLPPLIHQSAQLWSDLPNYIARLQRVLVERHLLDREMSLDEILKTLPAPSAALPALFGALQSVIGALGTIIAILVLPYYLLVESESLQSGMLKLFPPERRPWVARITSGVTGKVGAWLNGQLLLSAIIGVTASLGLWLLGVPYFYVLGLIAAIGEFVPVIGPIVSAIPAVLLGLTVSVQTGVFVAVYFSVQQFIEGNILVPRVMQRQVGVSAWTVIVALLIGSELLGIVGAILAVPSAAIVQVFLHEYLDRDEAE